MHNEWLINNVGKNWRQVRGNVQTASSKTHVGYDTLYAYLFQSARAYIQKRVVAGCNVVIVVAHMGDYDTPDGTLQEGKLVMGWMVVYTDMSTGRSPVTTCLYSHSARDVQNAIAYYDGLVNTVEAEV